MDALTLFGLFAVTAMLVCYALERAGIIPQKRLELGERYIAPVLQCPLHARRA
jgi:hypothetical protein